ncbi:phosphatidylinositol-specific phospholipase C domain-containing protein [Streptomyces sp. TRM 70351]|uniref:phosphatidylinositol-specific phospholipase C domain-containing protein n=1 Tax=Streptomyces sp. TRM 70351 TaxID=3116552 RepID=UPI002E7AFED3|nr:phosphatidylinositol-specific phospholipase C domain-containing protein [Streptomyces sp. TRM 70351]MEE1928648.1 phosphatidylinositol-specific phospholipase C domain-containing protein [Streptomyces sp. TRM 70351]
MRKSTPLAAAVLLAALATVPAQAQPRPADAGPDALPYSATTGVGVHNAYEQAAYPYLADALDSGAALLELDVWTNAFGAGWRVSHETPLWNANNCVDASSAAELRSKARNRDLAGCLSDLRAWHEANPGHRPIQLKIELKDGFNAQAGRGPAAFDALVDRELGDAVFRPADLMGAHPTPDAAARAGAWPSRDALAGKFLIHLIPGTVEEGNPFDSLWTDVEYARHLRALAASGTLGRAAAFPAVHRAGPGDPRERYADTGLRPWFVVFDGDAAAYAGGGVDTAWYARHHYLLVMTSAHAVPPALDARNPGEDAARARVAQLAAAHATVVSTDWTPLPRVLSTVLPRG